MNVLIAMDSMKGSLTSLEAGNAIAMGIRASHPDANIFVSPLADGGEGTVEALTIAMHGKIEKQMVTGPLGTQVEAIYGLVAEKKLAIIEMAQAAGITLLTESEKNPLITTTYGVGELILDAIQKGCRHFIVGIGGSATNDGGAGMLQALGYALLDENHKQIGFGAKGLRDLKEIGQENVPAQLAECDFKIACDVKNPLCGSNGCSAVFGPQKGATPSMVIQMDEWMENYAKLAEETRKLSYANLEGVGAAGGLGFAFMTFMNAELKPGIEIVLEQLLLEEHIKTADIVITGEGRMDAQTIMGKAPIGVARLAKKYDKKVIAFAGSISKDVSVCNAHGIDAIFSITREPVALTEAMEKEYARKNMTFTAEQVFRLLG